MPQVPQLNIQYPNAITPALAAQQIVGNQQRNALLGQEEQRRQQESTTKLAQEALTQAALYVDTMEKLPEDVRAKEWPVAVGTLKQIYGGKGISFVDNAPDQYDPVFFNQALTQMKGLRTQAAMKREPVEPKIQNFQVGDQEIPHYVYPDGRPPVPVPGMGGPKWNPKEQEGISSETVLPDGTIMRTNVGGRGKAGSATGVAPKTQSDIEEKLSGLTNTRMQLFAIGDTLQKEYTTYAGRLQAKGLEVKDKLGYDLSPEEGEFATNFQRYKATAGQLQAEVLKAMAGTALTPTEERLHKQYLINPGTGLTDGDSYTQAKSKLERYQRYVDRAIARANYIRKFGFSLQNLPKELEHLLFKGDDPGNPNVPQAIDDVMNKRGMEIYQSIKKQNPSATEEDAQSVAAKQLAKEFGLVY